MRNLNTNFLGIGGYGSNTTLCIGMVKNNADPVEHGRLQIFIPSIDNQDFNVEDLPWANYVAPFGGSTANFKVGRDQNEVPGVSSYGFWAIPKNGAQVLCGFLESDPSVRFWLGCFYIPELNRTLPQSVNDIKTEIDESGLYPQQTIPHYEANLKEAGLGVGSKHYKTRGGWERSVSYPSNKDQNKPTTDGYYPKPLESDKSDSQIYSMTTPGRHYMLMSDVANNCKIKFKTTEGTQIILDDTNERIYISTAKGRNWIEIDEGSGKMYFYTASKFSVHSENDLNLYSDQNINIVAKKRVNIESEERGVKIQSKMGLGLLSSGGDIKITASRDLHLKTTNGSNAGGASGSMNCNLPPYSGVALGLIKSYEEEAGSSSSKIFINASDEINLRSDKQGLKITGKDKIELKSMTDEINLSGSNGINFLSGSVPINFNTSGGVTGLLAIDDDTDIGGGVDLLPVISGTQGGAKSVEVSIAFSANNISSSSSKAGMIIPQHEPWIRDEDENSCKTPRNKNYQG